MKLCLISVAALTLAATPVHAQPDWNFDQVMQAALTSHPLLLSKLSTQAAAQADREGAEWQRFPSLSLEAVTQDGGAGLLRIEQPLWTGGRISAGINAAGSRFGAAGAALDEAGEELTLKVIGAASEALRQQARQQHGVAGVKAHEKLLAMIQRRVAQEVSPIADQSLAASRLYAATNELSLITQALNNALAQLSQLAGQPVTTFSAQGLSEVGAPASLESAMNQALDHSPTLQRLRFEEEAANADIASKRSVYMPQLALRLETSTGQALDDRAELETDNRAMLVLLAQPGAGLSAKSGADAAVARREAVRMARDAAVRDVRERITLNWNEWEAAPMRLKNADQARSMSIEVSESYARQYTAGRKSWIDVMNAVRETTQSELAADDAYAQMLAVSLRLRALTGKLGRKPPASP